MFLSCKDMPFTIIPVNCPISIQLAQGMSLAEVYERAAKPEPFQMGPVLEDKENFSRDLRRLVGVESVLLDTFIKLPHTPAILHQYMGQFIEPICYALRARYGSGMQDKRGEFVRLIISQKTLQPGDFSLLGGTHIDASFKNLFRMESLYSDLFIVSDVIPTMMMSGGFDLKFIMDFIRHVTTEEQRQTEIPPNIVTVAEEEIAFQAKHLPIAIPQPYQMVRYNDFILHGAQMAKAPCRRTLIGIQFFSACSVEEFKAFLNPDMFGNGRLADYIRDPVGTICAHNARVLDIGR